MSEPWIIAVITNGAILIGSLWAFSLRMTWRFGEEKAGINETINSHADDNAHEFFKIRQEMGINDRNFAETITAIKQKTNDVQLEAAKTYVNHEGFKDAIKQISETISILRSEIRSDLRRMEQKIDDKS